MLKSVHSLADEKFENKKLRQKKIKKEPLDSYKYREDPFLQCFKKKPAPAVTLRFQASPDTLTELAANIVRKIPLPAAHRWTNLEVIKWIDELGFPEYRNAFYVNFINGYTLIYLDASSLVAMNITKKLDINKITKAIRNLYGIEMSTFLRSISLPPRYPFSHFKYYRSNTGTKYHNVNAIELFRKMKLISPSPTYDEHMIILKKWLMHQKPIETEIIGYNIKNTLYKTKPAPETNESEHSKGRIQSCRCNLSTNLQIKDKTNKKYRKSCSSPSKIKDFLTCL